MGKPSIFSNEYDRKMRARKRRKVLLIISLIVGAIVFLVRASFVDWLEKNAMNSKDKGTSKNGYLSEKGGEDKSKVNKDVTGTADSNPIEQTATETPVSSDKTFELKMPDGKIVKVTYSEEASSKKIKNVINEDNYIISYNINPSANKVVLLDAQQNMFVADIDGNLINITRNMYVTQSTGTVITKEAELQKKPDFIWHSTPKFINDTSVVYITQIPWFTTTKYVYKVDLNGDTSNLTHLKIPILEGESMKFDVMDEKGLLVTVDSVVKHIDSQGNVTD